MKIRKLSSIFIAVILLYLSCVCYAQEAQIDKARCYTTWDDIYVYFAFKIDSPNVRGTNTKPNANIDGGDSVAVYVETDNKHSGKITPSCYAMKVSAAGGCQFFAGTDKGTFEPKEIWSFKYGVNVQGTINNDDDIDQSYSVEIAIPWLVLNTNAPQTSGIFSYNAIIRTYDAKSGEFISVSSNIKTEEDITNPSKWTNLVLAPYSFAIGTVSLDKIMSAKYLSRPPTINGILAEKEWSPNTSFTLNLPAPKGVVYEIKFAPHKNVFAYYNYKYQFDSRKQTYYTGNELSDKLTTYPTNGEGPWMSFDRVQWHKSQLLDMASEGIDVVLPIYQGDTKSKGKYSSKGLDCLISAIDELKYENKPYPMVAMFFDTSSIIEAFGNKPDLTTDPVKSAFYNMIKDFYERVPTQYRAIAQTGKPIPGTVGNIIVIKSGADFSKIDNSIIEYCNYKFEDDFGSQLIWITSRDFASKALEVDGIANQLAGVKSYVSDSRITIGSLGPGNDSNGKLISSRMDGETYQNEFESVLAKNPYWIFIDSWNDYYNGSNIASCTQYGNIYEQTSAKYIKAFKDNTKEYDAQYVRFDIPKYIPYQKFTQAEITIKNDGNLPWKASDGYALAYRWYKDGRYFSESRVKRPLQKDIMPGESATVSIGVTWENPVSDSNFQTSDFVLRMELVRMSDNKWFSTFGDQPILVPVVVQGSVANDALDLPWKAKYLSCEMPSLLAAGVYYPSIIRVRNEGTQTWKKDAVKIGCKLFTTEKKDADYVQVEIPVMPITGILAGDCQPGQIGEFRIDMKIAKPSTPGTAPIEYGSNYQLQFNITGNENQTFITKAEGNNKELKPLVKSISIFEKDYSPRIVDCDIPKTLSAGKTVEARVIFRNNGPYIWSRKNTFVGCHLYHADGSEMVWNGQIFAITSDMVPGWPTILKAKVKAPDYDGRYVMVWDVIVDGKWLSSMPLTRGGDILPVYVEVTGGRLSYLDLSGLYDTAMTSFDVDRSKGDFNGKGMSFPAEYLPPMFDENAVYPSGYNLDNKAQPEGRISFKYPAKSSDKKNALSCKGQQIAVSNEKCVALHIAASSVEGSTDGEIGITYTDGNAKSKLTVNDWTTPASSDKIAFATMHKHNKATDEFSKTANLYHYTIPLDVTKQLTGITLPNNPKIKITAITLEKDILPPPPVPTKAGKKK